MSEESGRQTCVAMGNSGSRWESEDRVVEGRVKGPLKEGLPVAGGPCLTQTSGGGQGEGWEWRVVVSIHCLCRAKNIVTSPSWRNTQFQWQGQRQEFSKPCPASVFSYPMSLRSPAVCPKVFKGASCRLPGALALHPVPPKFQCCLLSPPYPP